MLTIPTRSCLGLGKGWLETLEKFINTPLDVCREDYFKTYGKECYHRPSNAIFLDANLREWLKGLEYINKKCKFNRNYAEMVRYSFQIPLEYEIRIPKDNDFIFFRGGDIWVGIPSEHFRAGLCLPMQIFFHTLMENVRLGLGQLGPILFERFVLSLRGALKWPKTYVVFVMVFTQMISFTIIRN